MNGLKMSVIVLTSAVLSACSGYKGNVEAKARAWADDCGCDKVSDFRIVKYVGGVASNNNGESFNKPAQAAYAEFEFNCYYNGVGSKKWTFATFMLNHPVTDRDFGFMGDESIAKSRAAASEFRPG